MTDQELIARTLHKLGPSIFAWGAISAWDRKLGMDHAGEFIAALDAEGRVIVPKEPTQGMLNAAVDATDMGAGMSWRNRSPQKVAADIYRAMIAAGGDDG